ncbi:transposase [Cereibacter azotoformans]|uniref:IS66-like element accessory protein TnpA n=1 Tax=Cereibacter azotoformans TaxID=43057 RepID=UPI000E359634|nr:transposase [Cereibacter azotoformans]AXQ96018.1 transposase [Cereibacter sphaeroides]UIJ33088.1 transposase [Cereibacter azotoformans]ULB10231.1 transposase [Cereibacter azotoformans]
MSCAKVISQFEVFAAGELGRRRTWSDAEKIRIVEESYRGHRQGSVVARRHGISRALLTQWRRAWHKGLLDGGRPVFTPVEIGPDLRDRQREAPAMQGEDAHARIEITLANGRRLAVSADIEAVALTRLVQVLERA